MMLAVSTATSPMYPSDRSPHPFYPNGVPVASGMAREAPSAPPMSYASSPSWHSQRVAPEGHRLAPPPPPAQPPPPPVPSQPTGMPTNTDGNEANSPNSMPLSATGRKRKRLQKACVSCHKAKRRCDGGLPCSNCDFSGRTCAYADAAGNMVPPPKREAPSSGVGSGSLVSAPGDEAHTITDHGMPSERRARAPSSSSRTASGGHGSPDGRFAPLGNATDVYSEGAGSARDALDVAPELRRELLAIFFSTQQPFSSMVDEATFYRDLSTSTVSPILLASVYALAAQQNPHRPVEVMRRQRVPPPGEEFARAARRLLSEEDANGLTPWDEPSLETTQSLALLAVYELCAGRRVRAAQLICSCVRSVTSMRLHQGHVPARRSVTYGRESDLRMHRLTAARVVCVALSLDVVIAVMGGSSPSCRASDIDMAVASLGVGVGEAPDLQLEPFVQLLRAFGIFAGAVDVPALAGPTRTPGVVAPMTTAAAQVRAELSRWSNTLDVRLRFDDANLAFATRALAEPESETAVRLDAAWCWVMMHAIAETTTFLLCSNEVPTAATQRQLDAAWSNLALILDAMGPAPRRSVFAALPLLVSGRSATQSPDDGAANATAASHPPMRAWQEQASALWNLSDDALDAILFWLGGAGLGGRPPARSTWSEPRVEGHQPAYGAPKHATSPGARRGVVAGVSTPGPGREQVPSSTGGQYFLRAFPPTLAEPAVMARLPPTSPGSRVGGALPPHGPLPRLRLSPPSYSDDAAAEAGKVGGGGGGGSAAIGPYALSGGISSPPMAPPAPAPAPPSPHGGGDGAQGGTPLDSVHGYGGGGDVDWTSTGRIRHPVGTASGGGAIGGGGDGTKPSRDAWGPLPPLAFSGGLRGSGR